MGQLLSLQNVSVLDVIDLFGGLSDIGRNPAIERRDDVALDRWLQLPPCLPPVIWPHQTFVCDVGGRLMKFGGQRITGTSATKRSPP